MCTRALAQRTEKEISRKSARACVQVVDPFLSILQKEKKVVFTAAIHRSISRPFLEISKRIFDSSACVDLQIFHTNAIHTTRLSTSNAHLSLFSYASERARERERVSSSSASSSKERREREKEIFFRSLCVSVEFFFFFFPQEDEEEEEEEDF